MISSRMLGLVVVTLATSPLLAQDAKSVVAEASRAMGVDGLSSITYYGSGANYNLGQNNNANYPWPRINLNDYRRTIDLRGPLSLATAVTVAVPVTGGPAAPTPFTQNINTGNARPGRSSSKSGLRPGASCAARPARTRRSRVAR